MYFAQNVRDLATQTGDDQLDENDDQFSDEMIDLLATYDPPAEYNGKAVGILWDYANYSGTFRVVHPYPVATLTSFNNKAESYSGTGLGWYFAGRWYKQKSVVLFAIPSQNVTFNIFGMSNTIESRI